MESQNIEFRAVIKFLTKEGAKAKEIHRCMADVYGDSSPKYSTFRHVKSICQVGTQKPEQSKIVSKGWSQVKNFWKCTMPIQKIFTLVL